MQRSRVLVAMSGGVDSSLTAALLQEAGHEVIGCTLRLWTQSACGNYAERNCCSSADVDDARLVAERLGMRFYVLDKEKPFRDEVIEYALAGYRTGCTPNPCIICNEKIKFAALEQLRQECAADYIATGHYARCSLDATTGEARISMACDRSKDQSYFLFRVPQEIMAHVLLPLGEYTKVDVRRHAQQRGLSVHDKPDSQEICFRADGSIQAFLKTELAGHFSVGDIVDQQGAVLGRHPGLCFFTIGQRRGLGIAHTHPLYVIALDQTTNRVIVGPQAALLRRRFTVRDVRWCGHQPVEGSRRTTVKIRYAHPAVPCMIEQRSATDFSVIMDEAQFAVTPGQAAVFYDDDLLMGGGWITSEVNEEVV